MNGSALDILLNRNGFAFEHAQGNERVLACLKLILRQFAANDSRTAVREADQLFSDIADWLRKEFEIEADWTSHVDTNGLPIRIRRFLSPAEARMEMSRSVASLYRGFRVREDEVLFASLGERLKIVHLAERSAEDREMSKQRIARFCPSRRFVGSTYLAIRDSDDRSYGLLQVTRSNDVTIWTSREFDDDGEESLPDFVRNALESFLRLSSSWYPENSVWYFHAVVDRKGDWHHIHDLPEGLVSTKGISLSGMNILSLPKNLDAGPFLILDRNPIAALSDGLKTERLHIRETAINRVPDGVHVRSFIDVDPGVLEYVGSEVSDDVVLTACRKPWGTVGELRSARYASKPAGRASRLRNRISQIVS